MAWTTPRTWVAGELVTAALLNTHVRDNFVAAVAPAVTIVNYTKGSDFSVTGAGSTSWADVDSTNLAGSITLAARTRIEFTIQLQSKVTLAAGTYVAYRIYVDGSTGVGDATYGMGVQIAGSVDHRLTMVNYITGLSAGAHTFKLQWKLSNTSDTGYIRGLYPVTLIAKEF